MTVTVTEIRVAPQQGQGDSAVLAFATVVLGDCFAVRDLRVLDLRSGMKLAMPSRKTTHPCPTCGCKNVLRANYCNHCGRAVAVPEHLLGVPRHHDVAHPITPQFRGELERLVFAEYLHAMSRPAAGAVGIKRVPDADRGEYECYDLDGLDDYEWRAD